MIRIVKESAAISGNAEYQKKAYADLLKKVEATINGSGDEVKQFYVDRSEGEINLLFIVNVKEKEQKDSKEYHTSKEHDVKGGKR